jgi:hypothetical protein
MPWRMPNGRNARHSFQFVPVLFRMPRYWLPLCVLSSENVVIANATHWRGSHRTISLYQKSSMLVISHRGWTGKWVCWRSAYSTYVDLSNSCPRRFSIAQHSTTQHSTAQHSTAQHSTAQHSTAQHITAQHSTAQHSTAQHITAQHNTSQTSLSSQTCVFIQLYGLLLHLTKRII